jgi:hypothetical protein
MAGVETRQDGLLPRLLSVTPTCPDQIGAIRQRQREHRGSGTIECLHITLHSIVNQERWTRMLAG